MSWAATAHFYDNLRRMLQAGFTIGDALERVADTSRGPYRQWASEWGAACKRGEALAPQLPERYALAKALIGAGEQSGRLPELCKSISAYYQQCHETKRTVISRSIYPVFLIHFATVVPVGAFSLAGFLPPWAAAVGPSIFWSLCLLIFIIIKLSSGRIWLHKLFLLWPCRLLTVSLSSYIMCLVLEACVSAGMKYPDALREAAAAVPNRVISDGLLHGADALERQDLPSCTVVLAQLPIEKTVIDLCESGEVSGTLDESLKRCANMESERFDMSVEWAAKLLNSTIYGIAVAVAVYVIFAAASAYVGKINSLIR